MHDRRAYIVRETAISAGINIVIGLIFFFSLFGGRADLPIWGSGLVLDCLPQGFMVGLMSVLPPSFITRSRIVGGRMHGRQETGLAIATRAVLMAIATMLVLTGFAAGLAQLSGAATLAFLAALLLKALASGIVTLIVTPLALRALLAQGSTQWPAVS